MLAFLFATLFTSCPQPANSGTSSGGGTPSSGGNPNTPGNSKITSITLSQSKLLLSNQTDSYGHYTSRGYGRITYTIEPATEQDATVTFTSSNSSVATVQAQYGAFRVEAVGSGTCTITATCEGKSATLFVKVQSEFLNSKNYTVSHWQENANDGGYTKFETTNGHGYQWDMTTASAKEYTGFVAQPFSQVEIPENGDANITIQYKRKLYTLTLDLDGGETSTALESGNTITRKYGATLPAISNPTKDASTFAEWNPPIPATLERDITCKAVFFQAGMTVLEKASLLLPMPQYDGESLSDQTFTLENSVTVKNDLGQDVVVNVTWSQTGLTNGSLSGSTLTIKRDLVVQNIQLEAELSYNGDTATKVGNLTIAVPSRIGDYTIFSFTPNSNGTTGTLSVLNTRNNIEGIDTIYDYTVDSNARTITVTKTHARSWAANDNLCTKEEWKQNWQNVLTLLYSALIPYYTEPLTLESSKNFHKQYNEILSTYPVTETQIEEWFWDTFNFTVETFKAGATWQTLSDTEKNIVLENFRVESTAWIVSSYFYCSSFAELQSVNISTVVQKQADEEFTTKTYLYHISWNNWSAKLELTTSALWDNSKKWLEQNGSWGSEHGEDTYYAYTDSLRIQNSSGPGNYKSISGTWNADFTTFTATSVMNGAMGSTSSATGTVSASHTFESGEHYVTLNGSVTSGSETYTFNNVKLKWTPSSLN